MRRLLVLLFLGLFVPSGAIQAQPLQRGRILINLGIQGHTMPIAILSLQGKVLNSFASQAEIETDPSWGPHDSIVFSTIEFAAKRSTISTMNGDGTGLRALLSFTDQVVMGPCVSPDGIKIAFWATESQSSSKHRSSQIYVSQIDGTNLRAVGPKNGKDPRWSRDGKQILFAYRDPDDSSLRLMDADGSNMRVILELPGSISSPSWGPDGNLLAFCFAGRNSDPAHVFTVSRSGEDLTQLTEGMFTDASPEFSDDGREVVFTREHYDDGTAIWIANRDTNESRQLTSNPDKFYLIGGGPYFLWMSMNLGPPKPATKD